MRRRSAGEDAAQRRRAGGHRGAGGRSARSGDHAGSRRPGDRLQRRRRRAWRRRCAAAIRPRSRCACRNWSRRSARRMPAAGRGASNFPSGCRPNAISKRSFRRSRSPDRHAVLITLHDLTSIRRVEEMRADFVANASHELRTPLAALTGFIETMQGPARDDPAARDRFLGIMREQAWRMARLIDDLLSLSRIELRAHMRPDTPVDLVPIVRAGRRWIADAGAGSRRDGQGRRGGGAADRCSATATNCSGCSRT